MKNDNELKNFETKEFEPKEFEPKEFEPKELASKDLEAEMELRDYLDGVHDGVHCEEALCMEVLDSSYPTKKYYQHEDTGRICCLSPDKYPGHRWFEISKDHYDEMMEDHEVIDIEDMVASPGEFDTPEVFSTLDTSDAVPDDVENLNKDELLNIE